MHSYIVAYVPREREKEREKDLFIFSRFDALTKYNLISDWMKLDGTSPQSPHGIVTTTPRSPNLFFYSPFARSGSVVLSLSMPLLRVHSSIVQQRIHTGKSDCCLPLVSSWAKKTRSYLIVRFDADSVLTSTGR